LALRRFGLGGLRASLSRGLRPLAAFRREFALALAAIIGGLWGFWASEPLTLLLTPPLKVSPRLIRASIGVVGALAGLYGASSFYLALLLVDAAVAIVYGQTMQYSMVGLTLWTLTVSATIFYMRRYADSEGIAAPQKPGLRAALLLAASLVAGVTYYSITSLSMGILGAWLESFIAHSVLSMPYTLREFYSTLLSTAAGRLLLVAITAAVILRLSLVTGLQIADALTANPRSALSELSEVLIREMRVV
jgi:hypothetical protein